jgi:hypothetical protein
VKLTIKIFSILLSFCLSSKLFAQEEVFTDERDGQTYNIIQIGEQVWLASNLNYESESSTLV